MWYFESSPKKTNLENRSKRAGSYSMKPREINVYQCIVNIYQQDFGVYFRRGANLRGGHKAEQHASGKASVGEPGDGVLESQCGVGVVAWWFWTLVVFMKVCWWLVELWSLLGWLWWRWILRWAEETSCPSSSSLGGNVDAASRWTHRARGGAVGDGRCG